MPATIAGTTPPTLTYRPHKPYLCERPAPRELLEQSVGNRLYQTNVARQRQRRGSAPTTATKHLQRRDSNAPTDKHERFVRWPFNINGWFTIWPFDESFHLDRPAEPRHLVIPAAQNSRTHTQASPSQWKCGYKHNDHGRDADSRTTHNACVQFPNTRTCNMQSCSKGADDKLNGCH